jgi:hypothetical protein
MHFPARKKLSGLITTDSNTCLRMGGKIGSSLGVQVTPTGLRNMVTCIVPDAAPSAAPAANITVSPTIQTQVSPQVSPVFQQQFQPSNSPAVAGTAQTIPTAMSSPISAPVYQAPQYAPPPQPQYVYAPPPTQMTQPQPVQSGGIVSPYAPLAPSVIPAQAPAEAISIPSVMGGEAPTTPPLSTLLPSTEKQNLTAEQKPGMNWPLMIALGLGGGALLMMANKKRGGASRKLRRIQYAHGRR